MVTPPGLSDDKPLGGSLFSDKHMCTYIYYTFIVYIEYIVYIVYIVYIYSICIYIYIYTYADRVDCCI